MGFEYMLDFNVGSPAEVDGRLRRVAGFERFDSEHRLYIYRRRTTAGMPDAYAKLEHDGVYVCDNGGAQSIVDDICIAIAPLAGRAELREL